MRKHAIIKNNKVSDIVVISEDEYSELMKTSELLIDIQDLLPEPQIGWDLKGNHLEAPNLDQKSKKELIMDARFKFGNDLADKLVKKMSIRNLELVASGQTLNIGTVIQTFAGIEQALRKCAIPTAKAGIQAVAALYPEYSSEFGFALSEINNYLYLETLL